MRGWIDGGPGTLGAAGFQADIIAKFNTAIANTISMHGQGIIVWDITGCGETAGTGSNETYLGDPRFLNPKAAGLTVPNSYSPYVPPTSVLGLNGIEPAMDAIADQLFSAIRNAGLKCGVCLRAQKVYIDANGDFQGNQGTYGDNEPNYDTVLHQLADLDAKLMYAYNRWGCRIFYVDSNEAPNDVGPYEQAQGNPTFAPAWVYTQLNLRHPDCVIFPEEHYNGPFTYAGPPVINDPANQYQRVASRYTALWFPWMNPFIQPDELAAVPDSFTLIDCANMGTTDTADTPNIIAALQANQCILMAQVWWSDPSITLVNNWQIQASVNGF